LPNQSDSRLLLYQHAKPALREERMTQGLALREVAGPLKIDISVLAKIERGERCVSPELQEALSHVFDRQVGELFHGAGTYRFNYDAVRQRLLAEAGACGSPTCTEQICAVSAGLCHRPTCGERAPLARQTRADARWVKGYPIKYCSERCARLTARERLQAPHAAGLVPAREVARRVDRAHRDIVCHYAGRVVDGQRLGQQIAGTGPHGGGWFFTEDEIAVIQRHTLRLPHGDPRRRANWYKQRHNSTSLYGRLAPVLAAERGKTVGRPLSLTAEQADRIHRMAAEGASQRTIAYTVGVSRASIRNVLRLTEAEKKVG
jgi:transcriptional regulator with XRE-family HTH domain